MHFTIEEAPSEAIDQLDDFLSSLGVKQESQIIRLIC